MAAVTDLRLRFATATIFFTYDEVTAQAQRLVDDRDRYSGDSLRFLLCATTGLRRDALRSICSHLRPECFGAGSAADRAAAQFRTGHRYVCFCPNSDRRSRAKPESGCGPIH